MTQLLMVVAIAVSFILWIVVRVGAPQNPKEREYEDDIQYKYVVEIYKKRGKS